MRPDRDQLDDSLLLDLIEGNLDPAMHAKLAASAANQPTLSAHIDAMRHDRELLWTAIVPEPRGGIVDRAIQAAAARQPLPVDQAALQWRRRFRHHDLRPRVWAGVAAAAVVIAVGCIWILLERGSTGLDAEAPTVIARAPESVPADHDQASTGAGNSSAIADRALAGDRETGSAASSRSNPAMELASTSNDRAAVPNVSSPVAVMPVALVIRSDDVPGTVAQLRELVHDLRNTAALVSNLTEESVQQLQMAELMNRERNAEQIVADSSGARLPGRSLRLGLARDPAERIAGAARKPRQGEIPAGEMLEGRRDLAASYVQQLEFADAGATLTLTIPAAQLNAWLAQVQETVGAATELRAWSDDAALETTGVARPSDNASQWLAQLDQLRGIASEDQARALVLLPIMIEAQQPARSPQR